MCTNLIHGWRSRERHPVTGKRQIVYQMQKGLTDLKAVVPCGQCMECRLKHSRETAIRCVHEASLHKQNCVITLTYSNENLPIDGSIFPEHVVKFIKDVRAKDQYKNISEGKPNSPFKTYGCAEYGEKFGRPHYHIILFGKRFDDEKEYTPGYYTSEELTEIWGKGQTQIMDLTFESAAYVARYITKKLTGRRKEEYGIKLPEQTVCVTQKGLGKEWFNEWKEEIYDGDKVYRQKKTGGTIGMQPPKYYDRRYEIENNIQYERIKKQRKIKTNKRLDKIEKEIQSGNTTNAMNKGITKRDIADKICKEEKYKQLKRGYENET